MGSSKVRSSAAEALEPVVTDGQTIAVGGFGLSGNPTDLIEAVRDLGFPAVEILRRA